MGAIRPSWDWKFSERDFRTLTKRRVVRIEHAWKFTGNDTSESWINLTTHDNGDSKGDIVQVRSHMLSAFLELFRFAPDHAGLMLLTRVGEQALGRLAEIDKFEQTHDRDRREYERLKRKFEGGK